MSEGSGQSNPVAEMSQCDVKFEGVLDVSDFGDSAVSVGAIDGSTFGLIVQQHAGNTTARSHGHSSGTELALVLYRTSPRLLVYVPVDMHSSARPKVSNYQGEVIVTGSATGTRRDSVQRWVSRTDKIDSLEYVFDGQWKLFGSGIGEEIQHGAYSASGVVFANATFRGDLVVGGQFYDSQVGNGIENLARWNGRSWSELDGYTGPAVRHIAATRVALYIADGQSYVARYNGREWEQINVPLVEVHHIAVLNNQVVFAGPVDSSADNIGYGIYARSRDTWELIGALPSGSRLNAIAASGRYLFVGGTFNDISQESINSFAMWDGESWRQMPGVDVLSISDIAVTSDSVVAVGSFLDSANNNIGSVAEWTCVDK